MQDVVYLRIPEIRAIYMFCSYSVLAGTCFKNAVK